MTETGIKQINAGVGRIVLDCHGRDAVFSELSCTYPLKLLSPNVSEDRVAVVYILSYGGGLVGGDQIQVDVQVNNASVLVILSQGSTKIFKTRVDQRQASVSTILTPTTKQALEFTVADESTLLLLPDPVTCFRAASYTQTQIFHLSSSASLILLDWVTSGRKSLGEDWAFSRYHSVNEVFVDGVRIARDAMLLENTMYSSQPHTTRTLEQRLSPYSCYATIFLYGPMVQQLVVGLEEEYYKITVMQFSEPEDLLWSFSEVGKTTKIIVIRIAAKETELVTHWLRSHLQAIQSLIGVDVYRRVFSH